MKAQYLKYREYVLIGLVVALSYGGALGNGFTYDDRGLIVEDPRIATADWWGGVTQSYWGDTGDGLYRPLSTMSFIANWWAGGDRPWNYHLTNVALHALAACLLMGIATQQFGRTFGSVAALVFAVQPAPSEAVFSIVGRAELLACCWGLGAVACALRCNRRGVGWLAGVFVCLLASIWSKENGMAFTCGLVGWELARNGRLGRLAVVSLVAAGAGALVKWVAIGGLAPTAIGFLDNPLAYGPADMRWIHGFGLLVRAWAKMAFPFPLVADYSPYHIPVYSDWMEMGLWMPLAMVCSIGWWWARHLLRHPDHVLWAGISGSALIITSNIFVTTGTIFAERLLYLPTLGWSLGWAWCLMRIARNWRLKATALWVVVVGVILIGRSGEWANDQALFASVVAHHPHSARGHYGLALARHREGEVLPALAGYDRAIAIYPRYFEAVLNKGAALVAVQRYEEAEQTYGRAVELRPNHYKARYVLALLYAERGKSELSVGILRQLLREEPDNPDLALSLAGVLTRRGDLAGAEMVVEQALELDSDNRPLRQMQEALIRQRSGR